MECFCFGFLGFQSEASQGADLGFRVAVEMKGWLTEPVNMSRTAIPAPVEVKGLDSDVRKKQVRKGLTRTLYLPVETASIESSLYSCLVID